MSLLPYHTFSSRALMFLHFVLNASCTSYIFSLSKIYNLSFLVINLAIIVFFLIFFSHLFCNCFIIFFIVYLIFSNFCSSLVRMYASISIVYSFMHLYVPIFLWNNFFRSFLFMLSICYFFIFYNFLFLFSKFIFINIFFFQFFMSFFGCLF